MNNLKKSWGVLVGVLVFACIALTLVFNGISSLASEETIETVNTVVAAVKEKIRVEVEKIDGQIVKTGTKQEITSATSEIIAQTQAEAIVKINNYYDSLIPGVDEYLDWYYSLTGQWSQILNLGKSVFSSWGEAEWDDYFEQYLTDKMSSYLIPQNIDLETELRTILTNSKMLIEQTATAIISENVVSIENDENYEYVVNLDTTLDDIFVTALPANFVKPTTIAAAGIVTGVASGMIAKKIVGKVMTKTIGKLSVTTLSKFALRAIPVIGIAVGFLADIGFTELDEAVNRDSYKAEIVSSINEARAEQIRIAEDYFSSYNIEAI